MDDISPLENRPHHRNYIGISVIAAVGMLILFSFGGLSLYSATHQLRLIAHFQNVQGLREGAPVRVAGVDVGTVKSVRVKPEMHERPAEVSMVLRTNYDLRVPSDAVALLATAGVLGETFVDIDISAAKGPVVHDGSELPTRETPQASPAEMIEKLGTALRPKPCESTEDQKKPNVSANH